MESERDPADGESIEERPAEAGEAAGAPDPDGPAAGVPDAEGPAAGVPDPADLASENPDYAGDEAARPLEEGGEGVSEGFEESERELMESAQHGDPRFAPDANASEPERESDRSGAVYGEPDETDSTEVVRDPREGDDDPGAGPGLAPDR